MSRYVEKEAFIALLNKRIYCLCGGETVKETRNIRDMLEVFPAADVKPVPAEGIGEMSDGYHTFNGLYYQRMVLFAALVKAYKDRAWKSYKHEDGELCFGGGWFIVGIDTPVGSYTYHYENKHFDLFECKELPVGKHWDGHTEKDVTRLLKLEPFPQEMSAREYVIARRRLCNAHLNAVVQCADDFVTRCAGCLIEDYCEGAKGDVGEEIAIIEKWAREHPEKRSEE